MTTAQSEYKIAYPPPPLIKDGREYYSQYSHQDDEMRAYFWAMGVAPNKKAPLSHLDNFDMNSRNNGQSNTQF